MDRSYADHLNGMDAGAQERLVREGFAAKVRRFGKRIPFVRDAAAAYYAMLDPNVPVLTRAALVAPLVMWPAATGGQPEPARLSAAAVTIAVGVLTKNVILSIVAGATVLFAMLYVLG